MQLCRFEPGQTREVIDLYRAVFADAEGEEEGAVIGALVTDMLRTTDAADILGYVALDGDTIVGAIMFTRMTVPEHKLAFILSPVAVATRYQGKRVGQNLINHGLEALLQKGVELAFTYGDPAYYCQVGFQQISEDVICAPQPLSMPHGWLAQSLTGDDIEPLSGPTSCVDALNQPEHW